MSPWWGVRNLSRHPLRNGLAVLGIAVAAALLLDMVLLAGGLERSFTRLVLARGFQVRLSPAGTLPLDTEATLSGAGALVTRVRADPDVIEAGAVLAAPTYAPRGDSLIPLLGYGVDPLGQASYELLQGRELQAGDTLGALLGDAAAAALQAGLGDTITLVGRLDPQAASGDARALVVRGIVRWLYDDRTTRSVGTVLPVMQSLGSPGGDRASAIMIRVSTDSLVPGVVQRLRASLPGVEVTSVVDLVAAFRTRTTYFRQVSAILGTIAVIVTVLLVSTLLSITVNERIAEIATLRALGVSRASVIRQVLAEGTALTAAGAALGLGLGLVTARYLDRILTTFPGLPATISFFVPEPSLLAVAGLLLLATGMVSGLLPAWVAVRAPIAATLRGEMA